QQGVAVSPTCSPSSRAEIDTSVCRICRISRSIRSTIKYYINDDINNS
ncbi:MAG: hypothetical protein ACI9BS_001314, partial [Candidatus Poriferisodalaceae bacterium]